MQTAILPIGHFPADIIIHNFNFTTDINVIPDNSVYFDLIVSTNIIQQGTLTASATGATLCKLDVEPENF